MDNTNTENKPDENSAPQPGAAASSGTEPNAQAEAAHDPCRQEITVEIPAEEVAEREERVPGFVERLGRAMAASSPQLFPPPGGTIQDLPESSLVRITEQVVAEMAQRGNVVLVGRAAPAVLGAREGAFHVRLMADRPRLAAMGAAGRRKAETYAWPRIAARVMEVYRRVMAC